MAFCVAEQQQFVRDDLDVAGGDVGVRQAFAAQADVADGGHDELRPGGLCLEQGGAGLRLVDDDLGDAGAVAEVEEDEVAVVAAAVDPAHEDDGFARVCCAKVAAHVCALVLAEEV